jgi:DNA-binding CsgD family transcriptional regulator/extradiol dioxygenase family protein
MRGRKPHDDVLTPAEWRVVEAVRHGLSNRAIAARQGVSLDAVKFHVDNVLAKLGLESRMALRKWDGVARGTALAAREKDMTADVTLGALGQVSRKVRDIEAARKWDGEVLGLAHLYSFGDLAFFDMAGIRLFLSQAKDAAKNEMSGESILYFRVADIHAAQKALAARGAIFTHAPHMIHRHADGTEEWMAFLTDNDGRPLGLMAQVKAQMA